MDPVPAEGLALRQRRVHPGFVPRPPGRFDGPGPGLLHGGADGGRLPGGRARPGAAAAPPQRAVCPFYFTQAPRPGKARLRAAASLPCGL